VEFSLTEQSLADWLLQPSELGFGVFQYGDIRISIFPEIEEILIGNPGAGIVAG
jgi:hypothetical protein